ncbi:hypothetical protein CK203_040937 [Vitis vinifera]|uniref:Uncharacterized protein n=1 Tax=Vitis vinifera TaxID=29760 RepID=A0A438HVG4_VITVI|nr:hypothetical protein CK203_040937 [Vitis vinifera]
MLGAARVGIAGALTLRCPNVSTTFLSLPCIETPRLRRCGTNIRAKEIWNLVFVRDFNDWEMDMVGELLHTLRVIGLPWRMIQLNGGKEEMVFSGFKKLTGYWTSLMPQSFPQGEYGWIGCQLKSVFLLRRLHGGRCSLWIDSR